MAERQSADRIVVLDGGRAADAGDHCCFRSGGLAHRAPGRRWVFACPESDI